MVWVLTKPWPTWCSQGHSYSIKMVFCEVSGWTAVDTGMFHPQHPQEDWSQHWGCCQHMAVGSHLLLGLPELPRATYPKARPFPGAHTQWSIVEEGEWSSHLAQWGELWKLLQFPIPCGVREATSGVSPQAWGHSLLQGSSKSPLEQIWPFPSRRAFREQKSDTDRWQ